MRANKYAPDMSLEDVVQYVREHEELYDVKIVAVLDFTGGPGGKPFVTVGTVIGEGDGLLMGFPLVRAELPEKRVGGIVRALMNACAEGMALLDRAPWQWGIEGRRRVRGDSESATE